MQVLFCVHYAKCIYVVDRRIVFLGPRPGSQLEGRLCLPSSEKPLLVGPDTLPWSDVGSLLLEGAAEAEAEVA